MSMSEKTRLVNFYKRAMEDIIASLETHVWAVPSNPRHLALLAETKRTLAKLNTEAGIWAEEFLKKTFNDNIKFVDDYVTAKRFTPEQLGSARGFATINEEAINLLLNDPIVGLAPRLRRVSDQLGQSIESYIANNRLLLSQTRMLRERVAMNVLMGTNINQARDDVLRTLMNKNPPKQHLGLQQWRGGTAAQSLIEAPYYTVVTKNGPRRLHIFDHVQMTTTTVENEVRTTARNNRIQEIGIKLVRVTPNPPLTPCVCSLYAGRVFALDRDTAAKTGFPWLGDTPNGGPPFHPYCTHSTLPFIPEASEAKEISQALRNGDKNTKAVRGGFPRALIGKDFKTAQKYFMRRGGMKYGVLQNPQVRSYSGSKRASKEVLDALRTKRKPKRYRANSGRSAAGIDSVGPSGVTGMDMLQQEDSELFNILSRL